ncbi:MAG: hypothetical protein V6Z86_05640 [Hyphomicrobiales bacterium]
MSDNYEYRVKVEYPHVGDFIFGFNTEWTDHAGATRVSEEIQKRIKTARVSVVMKTIEIKVVPNYTKN